MREDLTEQLDKLTELIERIENSADVKESDRAVLSSELKKGNEMMLKSRMIQKDALRHLFAENQKVVPDNEAAINRKVVNAILFDLLINDNKGLNETQRDNLYKIALQCPLSGGNSVEVARGLLSAFNVKSDTQWYDDAVLCK